MRVAPHLAVFVPMLAVCLPAHADARRQTTQSIVVLRQWVDAVTDHAAWKPDAAVRHVAAMTYSARAELNKSYPLFMKVLQENFVLTRGDADGDIAALARVVRQRFGTPNFLKRAALLHTDALVFAGGFPPPRNDAPAPLPRTRRDAARPAETPPLLHSELISLARDGEVIGEAKADWHLPFARSLLAMLLAGGRSGVPEEDHAFVAAWYHAVAAFLFASRNYADATSHLQHAARVLPDDPNVLFDRATYAETLGLPVYQRTLDEQADRNGRYLNSDVPPASKTNEAAERLYRRTLAVDPSYVEARVRLARVLEWRGQREEAAAQVATALDAHPTGPTLFFTHLIAGRIASARGHYDEALRHYRAALVLKATAQSALLGASHAALMLSDVQEALDPLQQLAGAAALDDADPWLVYGLGAGRDADALLTAVWSRLAAPRSRPHVQRESLL